MNGGTVSVVDISTAPAMRSEDWDRFEVPEPYRAEIVRGELVVTPAPSREHVRAQTRLIRLLEPQLPSGAELLAGAEWRFDVKGLVALAPQPDLIVADVTKPLTVAPLLAVEVLSPSDDDLLSTSRIPRIEGKRLDYAEHGLTDYLEVDLSGDQPMIIRYELRDGELTQVARVQGSARLDALRPFAYSLVPDDLVL
jgi:Uma2 family endonuclease